MIALIHVKRKYLSKVNFKLSNKTICKKNPKTAKIVCRSGAGAGVVIRIYDFAEPEPKEIFLAPKHCQTY
jgi:hypothetical protein